MHLICLKCGSSKINEKPMIYPEQELEEAPIITQQVLFLCECGWGWNCVGSKDIRTQSLNNKTKN